MVKAATGATVRWRPRARPRSEARSRLASRYVTAALGLTAAALVLRLWHIDRESLWLDEGYTLLFSRLPLDRLFLVGGAHEHPPFYYLLVHLLLGVRDSYLVPRVISAVAGSLSVLVLYALGARLFSPMVGLLAAALLTISPFHVWYSQDGRAYELAGLLVLLSYLSLVSALSGSGPWLWAAYVVCTALALYTEYTTVFVLAPQVLFFASARRSGRAAALARAWLAVALSFAPWIGTLVLNVAAIAPRYWIPTPTLSSLVTTAMEFLGLMRPCPANPCVETETNLPVVWGHELLVMACLVVAVFAALAFAVWRRDLKLSLPAVWLLLPFALVLVLARWRSFYLDRVFLDATFALYLLAAAGIWWLGRRLSPLGALAALALLAAGLFNLRSVYADTTNPDWKSPARDLASAYRPGQAVVFHPAVLRSLVSAYLPAGWRATREQPLWYHSYLDVPGWQRRFASYSDPELRDVELSHAVAGENQVWLVTQDYTGLNDTRHWFLVHGFHLVLSEMYFDDTRLELWDRGAPAAFGPSVLTSEPSWRGWRRSGDVTVFAHSVRELGRSALWRSLAVQPGRTYIVDSEYDGIPPANPAASVQVVDRSGHVLGAFRDRFGTLLDRFPNSEWYAWPATGVWLEQPFGFVAPPHAARAILRLQNSWGETWWRRVSLRREP